MPDHVHMLLSIPPKYAVSQVLGFIKGKSAIHMARVYGERKRNFVGQHFWARGFFVNTVGRDEEATKPRKTPKWFALDENRPLFAFAGLWTPWRGARGPKSAPVEGEHELFGFLSRRRDDPEEVDLWLAADAPKALELQQPLPHGLSRAARKRTGRLPSFDRVMRP